MSAVKNIDEYINKFPEDTQVILKNIRKLVKKVSPDAQEMISYLMPTFDLNGKRLYFAANKKHIGFYAIYQPTNFEDQLTLYRSTKDTIRLPLDKPIPYDVIEKIIKYKLFD